MLKLKKINLSKRKVLLLTFFIPFLTVLITLISGGFAPFGSKDILTAGGYDNMIPFFHEFRNRLANGGLLTYSTNSGLGYDFTTVITYYLSDPTNFIVLLFPETMMLDVINIMFALKVGLSGLLFGLFLYYRNSIRNKDNDAFLITAFSASYALSSYMLSYGINITYTSAIAIFPILILGLDKIIHEKKWVTYLIALSLSIYFNLYISIISFIFSVFYLALQNYTDVDHIVKTILRKLLADILAMGISAVVLINSLSSPLLQKDLSVHFYAQGMYGKFFDVIKMMLAHSLPYQLTEDSYGISFYAGTICLFMLIPFLFTKSLKLSYRIKNLLMLVLLFFAGFSITSNYLFNAFFLNLEYKTFFGFLFCFMVLTIAYDTVIHLDSVKQRYIVISFASSIILIIMSMLFCSSYSGSSPFITTMEFMMIFFLLIIIFKQKNVSEQFFNLAFSIVIIIEMFSSCIISLGNLGRSSVSYWDTDTLAIEVAERYVQSQYPNSRLYVYDPANTTATPFSYALCGYDFIVAKSDQELEPYMEVLDSRGQYIIYKNPLSFSNGFTTNTDPSIISYNYKNPYTSSNVVASDLFNADPIFDISSGAVNLVQNRETGVEYLKITPYESGNLCSNLSYRTFEVNNVNADETIYVECIPTKLTIREPILSGELAYLNTDNFAALFKNTNFSSEDKYRVYNVSDPSKWFANSSDIGSFEVAGEEMVYSTSDSLSFIPIYFYIGAFISIISLMLTAAVYALYKKNSTSPKAVDLLVRFARKYSDQLVIFIISGAVFTAILMYTCCSPLGLKSISISDGYVQYYPLGVGYWEDYRNGNLSLLNYHIGFGMDNLILYTGMLLNPLNWTAYLKQTTFMQNILPQPNVFSSLWGAFVPIMLVCQLMYIYLTKRPKAKELKLDSLTLITASLAYGFSTYVIGYFTFFLTISYMLPIVMLVTEKLLYEKKVIPYVVVMFFVMALQNYNAFLLCEFLVLYFFLTDFESVKDFFMKGFRFALSSILSAGLAAIILLRFFLFTQSSPYQAKDAAVASSGFVFDHTLLKSLYDFQFMHVIEPVTDDNFRANTYCGIAFILILGLYFINKKIKLSIRIRTLAVLFLLYFAYGNSFLNYVFHGFHFQVMVPGRFAIFFLILLITTIVETISTLDICEIKKGCISLSLWYIVLLSGFMILNLNHFDFSATSTIVLLTIYAGLLIGYIFKKREHFKKAILYLTLAEVLINAYFISYFSIGQSVSHFEESLDQTKRIAEEYALGESKLTRTECLNYYMSNAACMINTNSVTYFSSNSTRYQADLSYYYNIETTTNAVEYSQGNPLANLMLSVKYFFTSMYNDYTEVPDYFIKLTEKSGITLYENPLALDPGIFVAQRENIIDDTGNAFKFQNKISNSLCKKDLYTIPNMDMINYADYSTDINSEKIIICQDEDESTTSSVNVNILVPKDLEGYTYFTYKNRIYYLGYKEKSEITEFEMVFDNTFELKEQFSGISVGILNLDNLKELYTTLSSHTMTDIKYGFDNIEGTINAPSDGTVFLSIPSYPTWDAYVDGQKVEWYEFLGGVGVPVSSGNHTVKMVYHTSGLKEGIIVSVISLIIFIIYIIVSKKTKKKETHDQNIG